jgi:hypothetical protein
MTKRKAAKKGRRGGFGYSTVEHEKSAKGWTDHITTTIVSGAEKLGHGNCEGALIDFIQAERELGNMACHLYGAHGGGEDLSRKFQQFEAQLRVGFEKSVRCLKGGKDLY